MGDVEERQLLKTAGPSRVRRARGFTLLEVLVALAILSLAIGAVIQGVSQSLRLLKRSGDYQRALLLADQKVREVLAPEAEREHGEEANFRWERVIRPVEAAELTPPSGPPRWRVFEITVRVIWDERRQLELATLRTVPAVAMPGPGTRAPGQSLFSGAGGIR